MAFVDRTFTTSIGRVRWPRFESSLFNFYANLLTITASGFTLERYRPFDGNTVRGTRYAVRGTRWTVFYDRSSADGT